MGDVGSWGREKVEKGSGIQVIVWGQGEVAYLRRLRKGAGPEKLLCISHAYVSENNGCHSITMFMKLGSYDFSNAENAD